MGHIGLPWSLRECLVGGTCSLLSIPPSASQRIHACLGVQGVAPLQPAASLHLYQPRMWLRTEHQTLGNACWVDRS